MKRPLKTAQVLNPFGEVQADPKKWNDEMGRDLTYVPGFSDQRKERDIHLREFHEGERPGANVRTLDVNLVWARNAHPVSGQPDRAKVVEASGNGYQPVTREMVCDAKGNFTRVPWMTGMPPAARWGADGTLVLGDTTLVVATRETAARNEAKRQYLTAQRLGGGLGELEKAEREVGLAGVEPTLTKISNGPLDMKEVAAG